MTETTVQKLDDVFLREGVVSVAAEIELLRLTARFGDLQTVVRFRFYREPGCDGVWWDQSHHVHTPSQAGPYRTSRPWGDDLEYAVSLAINGIRSYYEQALHEGHTPQEAWLVPWDGFEW